LLAAKLDDILFDMDRGVRAFLRWFMAGNQSCDAVGTPGRVGRSDIRLLAKQQSQCGPEPTLSALAEREAVCDALLSVDEDEHFRVVDKARLCVARAQDGEVVENPLEVRCFAGQQVKRRSGYQHRSNSPPTRLA
jgi:hypothetical protein